MIVAGEVEEQTIVVRDIFKGNFVEQLVGVTWARGLRNEGKRLMIKEAMGMQEMFDMMNGIL